MILSLQFFKCAPQIRTSHLPLRCISHLLGLESLASHGNDAFRDSTEAPTHTHEGWTSISCKGSLTLNQILT